MPQSAARPRAAAPIPAAAPLSMLYPDRWLAVLRMVVGFWFLKSLWTKLTVVWIGGVLPAPATSPRWMGFLPGRLQEWAELNPIGAYRQFLLDFAIPNAATFAQLTAFGEVAVGLGLTFGLLTGYASLGGLFLMANYLLASIGLPFDRQGFHILLIACLLAFLVARAGRVWGLDGALARRYPRFGRVPLV